MANPKKLEAPVRVGSAHFGFLRVAAAIPPLKIADVDYNIEQMLLFAKQAIAQGAELIVFPELGITGYTLADLFQQRAVLTKALLGVKMLRDASKTLNATLVMGVPLEHDGKLFNTAAVISRGTIHGIVPKSYIPGYKEFYEERWFSQANDILTKEINLLDRYTPIGSDLLFKINGAPGATLGIEICEDLWVPIPPSSLQVLAGATIIANLSASNDLVGKADYRKSLVTQQSGRGVCAYVYASSGVHESTTDLVFGGHGIIAENGSVIGESKRFSRQGELVISDIDTEHLLFDREKMTSFSAPAGTPVQNFRIISVPGSFKKATGLLRHIDPYPFVPSNPAERDKRSQEIFSIQTAGLAKRLEHTGIHKIVLGLSGGLDSTLALLVSVETCKLLSLPLTNINAFTMPGFATSGRTKSNALKLAQGLGVAIEEIDITKTALEHFKDINHDPKNQNTVFENAQARYRTMILMNKANQIRAILVGTGDLSEIALGWSTFNGDHISHYNVNAGVPKTLVRYLVGWVSSKKEFSHVESLLRDILNTPVSPELSRSHGNKITQKTEDLIGPYALHDFFLYHFVRWGSRPKKILFLTAEAFRGQYTQAEIKKWLEVFLTRFFRNQWKRSVMADGPKVGSVSLSPRGDWRMPSDAEARLWLDELKNS